MFSYLDHLKLIIGSSSKIEFILIYCFNRICFMYCLLLIVVGLINIHKFLNKLGISFKILIFISRNLINMMKKVQKSLQI